MQPRARAPYPGLRSFRRDEADIFFGRDQQITELVERLQANRLLAIAGDSGCGKSSLVRAGLIPTLEAGITSHQRRWQFIDMRPGNRPVHNLAAALVQVWSDADQPLDEDIGFTTARLQRGPLGLVDVLHDRPPPDDTEVLLVVDQFEELMRFSEHGDDEAEAFVSLLLEAVAHKPLPLHVVLTLRTDQLGSAARFRGLPEALSACQYLTPRLTREQLHEAIVFPARCFDCDVDPALANQLINDLGSGPDELPVIQHALLSMWTHAQLRRGGDARCTVPQMLIPGLRLTMADYQELGGLGEAMSRHADEIFDRLVVPDQQRIARRLFCALWDDDARTEDSRRPCRLDEAAEIVGVPIGEVRKVADAFRHVRHCFLLPQSLNPLAATSVIDVSHESLFRNWRRLRDWIREESADADTYRTLRRQALDWRDKHGDLLPERNLERALEWRRRAEPNPAWASKYEGTGDDFAVTLAFLDRSERARDDRQRAAERTREGRRRMIARARARRRNARIAAAAMVPVVVLAMIVRLVYARHAAAVERRDTSERLLAYADRALLDDPVRALQLTVEAAAVGGAPRAALDATLAAALDAARLRAVLVASAGQFRDVALLPDGRVVTVGEGDGLAIWAPDSGRRLQAWLGAVPDPTVLAVSPDGTLAAVAGAVDGRVEVWSLGGGGLRAAFDRQLAGITSLAFSPDGAWLASGSADGSALLWPVAGGDPHLLADHPSVSALRFTHDSRRLATAGSDGRIVWWDVRSHRRLGIFSSTASNVSSLVFDPTGTLLATAAFDGGGTAESSVSLWDPLNHRIEGVLTSEAGIVLSGFCGRGQRLAGIDRQGTLRIWDVGSRREIARIRTDGTRARLPSDYVPRIALDPGGQRFATTSRDGTVAIWSTSPADMPDDTASRLRLATNLLPVRLTDAECHWYARSECAAPPTGLQQANAGRLLRRQGMPAEVPAADQARFAHAQQIAVARTQAAAIAIAAVMRALAAADRVETIAADLDAARAALAAAAPPWPPLDELLTSSVDGALWRVVSGLPVPIEQQLALLRLSPRRRAERDHAALHLLAVARAASIESIDEQKRRMLQALTAAAPVIGSDRRLAGWLREAIRTPNSSETTMALLTALRTISDDVAAELAAPLASRLLWWGDTDLAAQLAQMALDRDPDDDEARFSLGVAHRIRERFAAAIETLARVSPASNYYAEAMQLAGSIEYDHRNHPEEARRLMLLGTRGNAQGHWANLAEVSWATRRFDEAIPIARRVLAAQHGTSTSEAAQAMRFVLVASFIATGELDAARATLDELIAGADGLTARGEWVYRGSRWAAARIEDADQKQLIAALLDFVDIDAPRRRRPSPDQLRALLAKIGS